MKTKHVVRLFFIVALVFTVAVMVNLTVGNAYADSPDGDNTTEKLMGNPPEILKRLCPETLKSVMAAAAAGKLTVSPPDGAAPEDAGNTDMCVSINSVAFQGVPGFALGCNIWFVGMFSSTGNCPIISGINLPDGAEIYRVEITAIDNNATEDQQLGLFRQKTDGTLEPVASLTTTGQSPDIRQFSTTTIDLPTVVLPDYSYIVMTTLYLDIAFFSVRVLYHPHTDSTFKSIEIAD